MQTWLAHRCTCVLLGQAWYAPVTPLPVSPPHHSPSDSSPLCARRVPGGHPMAAKRAPGGALRLQPPRARLLGERGGEPATAAASCQQVTLPETGCAGLSCVHSTTCCMGCYLPSLVCWEHVLERLHRPAVASHPALGATGVLLSQGSLSAAACHELQRRAEAGQHLGAPGLPAQDRAADAHTTAPDGTAHGGPAQWQQVGT